MPEFYRSGPLLSCAPVISDNMFKLVLACALVATALADVSHLGFRPVARGSPSRYSGREAEAGVLRQSQDLNPDGSYQWAIETENGISAEEQGSVRSVGPEDAIKSAHGGFSWTSPEGELVQATYVADENGYQPQGSHIPVAPPIPPQILRALEWIAAHPQREDSTGFAGKRRF